MSKKSFVSEKQRRFVMMKLNKDTTAHQYDYGDFDEDGTPNIDDRYPLDPTRNERVNEILISEELLKIKKENEEHREETRKLAEAEGGSYRIKHPHSVVNKLRRKYLDKMKDIGAVRVIVPDKTSLDHRVKEIRDKYKDRIIEEEDFYKHPKDGYYYAHHFIIRDKNNRPIELQIQTKRMSDFYLTTHEGYKREWDVDLEELKREAEKIKKEDEK